MNNHKHQIGGIFCICNPIGLEPDEDCVIHGYGKWYCKCAVCGQFINHDKYK